MQLNQRAHRLALQLPGRGEALRIAVHDTGRGPIVMDCGCAARGGLEAGRALAEICMAGLGTVSFAPAPAAAAGPLSIAVASDHPVAACLAAQYAGWQISHEDFFAMGSGPMRAAAAREDLFEKIGCTESPQVAVGVLESRTLPPDTVGELLAEQCGVEVRKLTLLAARTSSFAGSVQICARSLETALHKLIELQFDVTRVVCGYGVAPLPVLCGDDLEALGRTNDAVLYGADVTLWVTGDDASLEDLVPRVPSCASRDHGRPFREIFEAYERDFYRVDPLLFSPARITLINVDTGHRFRAGRVQPDLLQPRG